MVFHRCGLGDAVKLINDIFKVDSSVLIAMKAAQVSATARPGMPTADWGRRIEVRAPETGTHMSV